MDLASPRTTQRTEVNARTERCLLIEGCDFISFPAGGQLSFAKLIIAAFGPRLALVGVATDTVTPVGRWIRRRFGDDEFDFFATRRRPPSSRRPLIPARISEYLRLRLHQRAILSLGISNAFVQAPEALMAVSSWGLRSICFRFPGVENPLEMPRYRWGRLLADFYEDRLFSALERTDVILASADEALIAKLVARSAGRLARERVQRITTYYDSRVFLPDDQRAVRSRLGLPLDETVVVSSGRINRVKGWDLVLDAFRLFRTRRPRSSLVFVGDGEERGELESAVRALGLSDSVRVVGFTDPNTVASWLNAADVVVVGSHREGWSLAMLEALACGKPLVSTDVSGARAMIRSGENGFVLPDRSPSGFAKAMEQADRLPGARDVSLRIARQYDLDSLARDIAQRYPILA